MTNPGAESGAIGRYVHANGIDIYYEEYGSGNPLLLLHGGIVSLGMWRAHLPVLGQHFRVIALDSRGHGRTKNPIDAMSYRLLSEDTAGFVHALGLERPFVCGYSDGGQIAIEMAIRYPGLAKAYMVYGSTYRWSDAYYRWLRQMGFQGPGVVDTDQLEREHPTLVELLRQYQDAFQGDGYWRNYLRQLSTMWIPPLETSDDDLRKIADPVLLFAGDRDDVAMPLEDALHMFRSIPGAELAVAAKSDHSLPLSNPAMFNSVALEFLLRHQAELKAA